MKNTLHFGDNLNVMHEMPSESYHLCYLDPPFNSGRNYNIFLANSKAQKKAFGDIWHWDDTAIATRDAITHYNGRHPELIDVMENVSECLHGFDTILKSSGRHGDSMRAYLTFMAPRLAEIYRLLKPTGSIYLHCDPHASHYLKCLLDVIFRPENFRNELTWFKGYRGTPRKNRYQQEHETILFYSKTNAYTWNNIFSEYKDPDLKRYNKVDSEGNRYALVKRQRTNGEVYYGKTYPRGKLQGDVIEIPVLASTSKERLGYPTQKPLALLERIIKASSNPGDTVFDPFCGCGTTIDAAHGLNRHWVGIDLTVLALEPMERRLQERHGLQANRDYHIEGYPTTHQDAVLLAEQSPNDFANWAVTRLGLSPTPNSNDGGFDGTGKMLLWENRHVAETEQQKLPVIAEVKSGRSLTPNQVRAFRTAMQDQGAAIGIFVTLHPVTRGMRNLAEAEGFFEHNNKRYPRLQFWQINDSYFTDGTILVSLPWQIDERLKASPHHDSQSTLF